MVLHGQLLDWLLGKGHFALLRRAELKTLVDMHGNEVSLVYIIWFQLLSIKPLNA